MEGLMTHTAPTRETIKLDEGDAIVFLPANLSRKSIEILRVQFGELAAGLNSKSSKNGQFYLRGLAGLAAHMAN